jgi:type IV pilus assembly protein PilA
MRKSKGFTLIELMVVILIVAILAAILAPMLTGRINSAKWSEGKAGAGTISTAIRAFVAEHEGTTDGTTDISTGIAAGGGAFVPIGILDGDLNGKYFSVGNYSVGAITYTSSTGNVAYTITITCPWDNTQTDRTLTVDTSTNTSDWNL